MRLIRKTHWTYIIPAGTVQEIRNAVNFFMPLGDERFKYQVERVLGRKIGYTGTGQPKRPKLE